jgi:putative flippase GtrA
MKVLNAFHLKAAMCILMVLNHMWLYIPGMPYEFHMAGRLVAPVFSFLIAQGMVHTSDRRKYIARLMIFGAVTFAGNALLALIYGTGPSLNILLSFVVAAQLIVVIDNYIADKRPMWLAVAALLAAAALLFEGAWIVTVPVLIFYYLRGNPRLMFAVYAAAVPAVLWLMGILIGFRGPGQWAMVFAVMPLMLYGGKRGAGSAPAKYFFYAFYPLHIWVLFVIGMWCRPGL